MCYITQLLELVNVAILVPNVFDFKHLEVELYLLGTHPLSQFACVSGLWAVKLKVLKNEILLFEWSIEACRDKIVH